MSKRFRCKDCGHTPNRVVSVTSKKNSNASPCQHKKPCNCACHRRVAA